MHLYKTAKGIVLHDGEKAFVIEADWDQLINRTGLRQHLEQISRSPSSISDEEFRDWTGNHLLAPVGSQQVWAAGVTYLRSRDARMEESKTSGGADFYQKVYEAERPELFFKSMPQAVVAPGKKVYIRKDATWNVPEPELTLYINSKGSIEAYSVGNDMSSRDIEGENPLYLPQAKVYDGSAAIGPCLLVPQQPLQPETKITLDIYRNGDHAFGGSITISRMKRSLPELAEYLYRESTFENGCFLMTGTGIVPPDSFTLMPGDEVRISIEGIGTLINEVAVRK